MANGISRQFSVVALSEGVIYEIVPTSDSIVIPSGNTGVQFSVTASFYRREGQDVRSAYSCYATVYRRRGGTFTRVQYLSIRNTEIALENVNVSVEDDALAIFIFDVNYTGTSPLTSQFLAKVELPVLKNGDNGMDTVNLDLDNENDSFLYDSLGVNHSQPVTSQARLYEGEETVSTGITWSISDFSGVTAIRTATNVDYDQSTYPSHAWVTPSGLLTVNGMNATEGYVTVCATYNEVEYRAKLTLRLIVNADKYDLAVNPSAIAYNNTTQTPASTTVKVNIYRTVIGIGRSALDSLPPGYTLSVYTSSGGTVTLTHASGSTDWTFSTVNSSYSSYRVVLTDVYDTVLDSETIPINKSSNGTNGSPGAPGDNAVVYEIVTDMDTLDAYTNQVSLNIRKTVGGVVTVFPCSNDQGQPFVTDGLSLNLAGTLNAFVVYGSASKINIRNAPHANGATLIVRLLKGGVQVAEKQMRVSYLTQYLMTATPSQVNIDNGGNFISSVDNKIKVKVQKILGNSEPLPVTSADGLEVYIKAKYSEIQGYPDSNGEKELALHNPEDTAKNPDGSRYPITVELINDDEVIDSLTIPIVSSGAQGLQGCSTRVSEFKEDTEYVNQDGINMEGSPTFSIGYIDVVAVERPKTDPDYDISDGYYWYMCNVESTADYDYLAPANGEDTWFHRGQSDEKLVWKAIGVQGPSFFSLLIAKNAWIKFGSGNQFVIQDSEGNIVAGLTGYIPDEDNEDGSVRIWAGGEDPALSPFRVLQSGDLYAEKAHIRGLVEVRDATDGLIVYDTDGNARVQVVANEVDEPVNQTIHPTLQARQPQYHSGESFNLTPTPISGSLGTLKSGAMLTVDGLSFTVSTNSGATHMRLTDTEKMSVSLVLMDTNGNVETTLESTYEATSSTLIENISFAFQGVLIRTTKAYVIGISARIEDIDDGNTAADTWGGLSENAPVTTVPDLNATHATPVGTRIGTNGVFVNLGTDKAVSINASSTDIRYGSSRFRVSNSGAYLWDGSEYVPIVKKTKIITGNYTVLNEDGVIFIDSSSAVTITINGASSSRDFTVISKQASVDYYITGVPVYRYDGTMYRDVPQRIDGQFPRRFVFDGRSSYYELFGGNF